MLKVEDFMTKDVITVKQETPIYEAMALMRKNNVTGMPVIDGTLSQS